MVYQQKQASFRRSFPLPKDTGNVLQTKYSACDNLSLLLSKFVPWQYQWRLEEKNKHTLLTEICRKARYPAEYLQNYLIRYKCAANSLRQNGYIIKELEAKAISKVVVGLGGSSIFETSITLHWLYGFPVIPGSAIKGVTKAYASMIKDPDSDRAFGSQQRQGIIVFFDGIPLTFPKLTTDIMNVHYKKYYESIEPPADYLEPSPVYFLAIDRGAVFSIVLAAEKQFNGLLERIANLTAKALEEIGIGGKTNAGYGVFECRIVS